MSHNASAVLQLCKLDYIIKYDQIRFLSKIKVKVKVTTKGRIGEGARKGGRICGAKCVPGPMDAFVERKAVPQDQREASLTEHRKRQRKKCLDKGGGIEEGSEGSSPEEEEQKREF